MGHALRGQLWRRVTLERAPALLAPTRELMELATRSGDLELVVPAAFFRSLFGYMRGLPVEWLTGHNDLVRASRCGGQPFYRYLAACCARHARARRPRAR